MHLPRQNKEDQNMSEDSNNPAEIYSQDPSKMSCALSQNCFASDKKMCVNNKLTFGTAVQAFQIFTIKK